MARGAPTLPQVYQHLHGDKDTFALAFALAYKAHKFRQLNTPPGLYARAKLQATVYRHERRRGFIYYNRYTYSSHSFGYSFSFSLKVLGVRAIVLGFSVRV